MGGTGKIDQAEIERLIDDFETKQKRQEGQGGTVGDSGPSREDTGRSDRSGAVDGEVFQGGVML